MLAKILPNLSIILIFFSYRLVIIEAQYGYYSGYGYGYPQQYSQYYPQQYPQYYEPYPYVVYSQPMVSDEDCELVDGDVECYKHRHSHRHRKSKHKKTRKDDCENESESETPITEKSKNEKLQYDNSVDNSCGIGLTIQTPLIHHGTPVSPGHFPWLVAVKAKQSKGGNLICGGSLVSTRTVISAAHCFEKLTKDDVELHIGRHNLRDDSSEFMLRNIQDLRLHPEYNPIVKPDADIAIMIFNEPVRFNENIKPICLWSGPTELDGIVGKKGFVAGWGQDEHKQQMSDVPKMVSSDIVDEATCRRYWGGKLVTPRSFCASNLDGSGPCLGDSGSGLMVQRNERWLLRGIVSVGNVINKQCNLNIHVIYCDTAKHLTWVQQNIV